MLTHQIGVVAYSLAAVSAAVAWIRARGIPQVARLAAWLTFVEVAFLLDMLLEWRWALHSFLRSRSIERHLYGSRTLPQIAMLVVLAVILLPALRLVTRRFQGRRGAILAVWGLLLSVACWSVEVISLHATDRLLYHFDGGAMLVAFVWIAACAMTALGLQIDASTAPFAPRHPEPCGTT